MSGLPQRWLVVAIAVLMLAGLTLIVRERRRLLEACLMLSFAASLDVHLRNENDHLSAPAGIPISLTGGLACLLVIFWLLQNFGQRPRRSLFAGGGGLIFGLWVTAALSVVMAPAPRFGIYALINLGYFTLLFLYLANNVETVDHLRFLLGCLIAAAVITSGVAIVQHFTGSYEGLTAWGGMEADVMFSEGQRVGGLLGGANGLAWGLVCFLPLIVALFLSRNPGCHKGLLIIVSGMATLALIYTYSRGGWLTFALVAPLVVILTAVGQAAQSQTRLVGRMAILGVLLALVLIPLGGTIYARLAEDDQGAAIMRVPMMKVALAIIQDNPMLGVGLGNYENVVGRYDEAANHVHRDFPWPVHNIYLNIAAEAGLPGGVCFLLVCLWGLVQGIKATRAQDEFLRAAAIGLLGGLIAYLMVGMKEPGSVGSTSFRFLWLILGLLVATRRLASREPEAKN